MKYPIKNNWYRRLDRPIYIIVHKHINLFVLLKYMHKTHFVM